MLNAKLYKLQKKSYAIVRVYNILSSTTIVEMKSYIWNGETVKGALMPFLYTLYKYLKKKLMDF